MGNTKNPRGGLVGSAFRHKRGLTARRSVRTHQQCMTGQKLLSPDSANYLLLGLVQLTSRQKGHFLIINGKISAVFSGPKSKIKCPSLMFFKKSAV